MNAVAFARETEYVVGGSSEGDVFWWSVDSGTMLGRVRCGPGAVTSIAASFPAAELAVSTSLGTVAVLDGATMRVRAVWAPQEQDVIDFVASVSFRPGVPALGTLAIGIRDDDAMSWTEVVSDVSDGTDSVHAELEVDQLWDD